MGLSEDDKMGDDLVVDCFVNSTGKVNVGLSYNHGKTNEYLNPAYIISQPLGRFNEGIITCNWKLSRKLLVQGKEFDLINKKYHILLAYGSMEEDGSKNHHDLRTRSAEPVDLASIGQLVSRDLTYLIRIHGKFT